MQALWLAKVEDDTIFIITLGVVLVVVIAYLVLGRDDTIRLQADNEEPKRNDDSEYQEKVIHRLDRANDLLTSIRNSILILIVLIALYPVLFLLFARGCGTTLGNPSVHVLDHPNTYNRYISVEITYIPLA